jgi:hypothetical protein
MCAAMFPNSDGYHTSQVLRLTASSYQRDSPTISSYPGHVIWITAANRLSDSSLSLDFIQPERGGLEGHDAIVNKSQANI